VAIATPLILMDESYKDLFARVSETLDEEVG